MFLRPLLDEELNRALDRRQRAPDAATLPYLDGPHRVHGGSAILEGAMLGLRDRERLQAFALRRAGGEHARVDAETLT